MHLKKGDLVDIICPASPISFVDAKKIKAFLKKNNLRSRILLENDCIIEKKENNLFPQIDKITRTKQLICAIKNKESKAVWCARGGYGSYDLIPDLMKEKKISQSKIFIGFSDITALQIYFNEKWQWEEMIYGPMLTQLALNKVSKESEQDIFDILFSRKKLSYAIAPLNRVALENFKISTNLVGGCLSVLCSSFSTNYEIDFNKKILFLEDVDESGEKLDRYFSQILQIIIDKNRLPSAIILGNFFQNVTKKQKKKDIELAINKLVEKINSHNLEIAVYRDKSMVLGHSSNIKSIVIGAKTVIEKNKLTQKIK